MSSLVVVVVSIIRRRCRSRSTVPRIFLLISVWYSGVSPLLAKRNLTYIHVETVYVDVFCTNIDQTLVNSLHRMLNCGISGVNCHVITTEYRTRVHYIHTYHLLCNALIRVMYSIVSGQYSYTIILAFIFLYLEMWWLKCLSIYEDECYTMRCSTRLYTVLFKVNILLSCFIFVYLWSFSVCIQTVFITYTI